ncbi:hypothetical protein B7463_g11216, partial [Scytalidium lignicola]
MRFTAIGNPMPSEPSLPTLAKSSMGGITAPQYPPFKFTDDSIIRVVVRIHKTGVQTSKKPRYGSRVLQNVRNTILGRHPESKDVKIVGMPRKDYFKYFARDVNNVYIGTEPERFWTEKELDAEFGRYTDNHLSRWTMSLEEGRVCMVEAEA